jgi:hypothetical protein
LFKSRNEKVVGGDETGAEVNGKGDGSLTFQPSSHLYYIFKTTEELLL